MDGWLAELSKCYKRNSAWWGNIHYPVYLKGVLPTPRGPLQASKPNQRKEESGYRVIYKKGDK